jgi:NitT/TauT family transport system permease protein
MSQPISTSAGKSRRPVSSFRISQDSIERLLGFASPLILLLIWELCAYFGWIDVRFFPAPSKIFTQLMVLAENGQLWRHFAASMQRLFWGFLFGGVPALILGVSMGLSRSLRMLVEPLISATYPVPKSAILPLVLLIFGLGEASKIFMVGIGIFYPIVINSMAGVLEINKIHFDVSRNFGAGRWQVFKTVALPGAMPLILTGVRLGIGLGLVLISLAEIVGAKSGLGFMMWNAWEILSVETMYVGLLVIAMLGIAFSLAITELERYIVPWKHGR